MHLLSGFTLSISLLFSLLMFQSSTINACTTFASLGPANDGGGLIIAKNRDSMALFEQLAVKKGPNQNTYLGIFYNTVDKTPFPYIAAGINEHGLSVVQNESASILSAYKFNDADQSAVMYAILENYSSVAEVLDDQEKLFGNGLANFLIIGDKTEAILVEVGPKENVFQILKASQNNNRLFHTNHYVLKSMRGLNKVFFSDSEDRFASIKSLMNNAPSQFTAEGSYYRWINSGQNGPYNSILREVTVASWVASQPQNDTPEVYVRFTSPSQTFQRYAIKLTPEFWSYPPKQIQPLPISFGDVEVEPVGSERRYTYTF